MFDDHGLLEDLGKDAFVGKHAVTALKSVLALVFVLGFSKREASLISLGKNAGEKRTKNFFLFYAKDRKTNN